MVDFCTGRADEKTGIYNLYGGYGGRVLMLYKDIDIMLSDEFYNELVNVKKLYDNRMVSADNNDIYKRARKELKAKFDYKKTYMI